MTGPALETERLTLRPLSDRDVAPIMDYFETERSAFNGGPATRGRGWRVAASLVGHWAIRGFGCWAFALRGKDRAVGIAGGWFPGDWPEREIAWTVLDAQAEGRGFAREAAEAARACLYRDFGWTTAVSYIARDNARSIALAERLGCVRDAAAPTPNGEDCLVFRHPAPEALQ